MIVGKTVIATAIAAAPGAAIAVSPAYDWNPIIAALIGAVPTTLGIVLVYWQGRKTARAVDGVVTKLLVTNTEKATAEAEGKAAPVILALSTEKATAEATIEAGRLEQLRQDTAAKGVVIIKSRPVKRRKKR